MNSSARLRTSSRAATSVAAVALALALAGCSATNELTTQGDYPASDGVQVTVGDLDLQNLLVLAAADGAPGTVLGGVTNGSDADGEVAIGLTEADATTVEVAAGTTTLLGPDQAVEVAIDAVPAAPGALVTLTVTAGTGESQTVQVPVLDGSQEQYADLVPES